MFLSVLVPILVPIVVPTVVPKVVSEAVSKVCRLLPAEETFCYANAETAIIRVLRAPRQSQIQIVVQLSRAMLTNDASRASRARVADGDEL